MDDVWPDDLFILQQRNGAIIYSGETALYLHGLTDREYSPRRPATRLPIYDFKTGTLFWP